jgi:hypothetical protein
MVDAATAGLLAAAAGLTSSGSDAEAALCSPGSSEAGDESNPLDGAHVHGLRVQRRALGRRARRALARAVASACPALATGAADQAMFFGDLPPFARAAAAAVGGEGWEESLRQRSPRFDAAAVNLYRPGDALTPHIDLTPRYRDGVAIVSLGGAVVVQFERVDADSPPATARALLRPGDILTMAGPARYTWTHGFAGGEGAWRGRRVERARVRVGVTLRRLRPDP